MPILDQLESSDPTASRSSDDQGATWATHPITKAFLAALGALLLGYMFLGRGFAHLGLPPFYVGEIVLALGIVATGYALRRYGVRVAPSRILWLLLGLIVLGAIRTVPYLGTYGLDALRDATLWGYALFAILVYVHADRALALRAFRLYGWVVPVFALWLPICYNAFAFLSRGVDPLRPGEVIPIIFFKGGDMAVHVVGAVAFLVLGASAVVSARSTAVRVLIGVPLVWTALVAGAANRGALLTILVGIAVIVGLSPRSRNWLPLLLAAVVLAVGLTLGGALQGAGILAPGPTPTPVPTSSPPPTPLRTPTPSSTPPTAAPTGSPGATPTNRPGPSSAVPTVAPSATAAAGPTAGPTESPGAAPPTPRPSDDLVEVENPAFESGPLGLGVQGWSPQGAGAFSIIGEGGYLDTRFVEVDNTGGPYEATLTSSRFALPADDDVQVSMRARAIRGSPTVEIYMNFYDRSGRLIESGFLNGLDTHGAGAWRKVSGTIAIPPRTTHAEVLLWEAAGHAAIGFDDVAVRIGDFLAEPPPEASPGGVVAVANPGFEDGPVDSGVEGWVPLGAGGSRIVAEGGHGGDRFAEVNNTGEAYEATLASSRFPFTAGSDIEVSLWAKATRGKPTVEVYLNWYDRSGRPISSVFLTGLATEGSRLWRQVVGTYAAPAGATQAEVMLWEASGHAAVGFDDVRVRAGDFIADPSSVPPPDRRPATLQQVIENIFSVFGSSSDPDLEGTKQFRLAWWGAIVDYTVFGDYFWTGKGFGVNLADADGFQSTADRSLRAPHNSHITVLARMGVPGFVLWSAIQAAFGIGLLAAIRAYRRAGDARLAAMAGWLLAYWIAMLVDTSFDPYLEGPQGGIWFWAIVGLGLALMRIAPKGRVVA